MRIEELLIVLFIAGLLLILPIAALVMSIVAMTRMGHVRDLTRRIEELTAQVRFLYARSSAADHTSTRSADSQSRPEASSPPVVRDTSAGPVMPATEPVIPAAGPVIPVTEPATPSQPVGWETFIGQKAFGWIAVVLFLFATTFFLRYAYQNNWVGPAGRVAIGELVGVMLVVTAWKYLGRGWHRFSTMLLSAGIVVLYLATYSAFGFYQLLPQRNAGIFLGIIAFESMFLAALWRSPAIGLVAVTGGLLTPLLMQSDHDDFRSLFLYLLTLNAATVTAIVIQRWIAVGSVAYIGSQMIFWAWYEGNYHPDKFEWALGYQISFFALYWCLPLVVRQIHSSPTQPEGLVRFAVNAIVGFAGLRWLLQEEFGTWMGALALVFAAVHALSARIALAQRVNDQRFLLTALAVAAGFVAWTIPVQANARWVAAGWAVMALCLWLFGLRISSRILRLMAAVLSVMAVYRVVMQDLPFYVRDPFVPLFNWECLPSLTVSVAVLAAVKMADRYLSRLLSEERIGIGVAGVTGTVLLWTILSLECHGWFVSRSIPDGDLMLWRWRAQLGLTVFWILFAVLLLVSGFRFRRSRLRWLSMVLFGVTIIKLFVVDMANVHQLYRIAAFLILAVVLGFVARAYQKFR